MKKPVKERNAGAKSEKDAKAIAKKLSMIDKEVSKVLSENTSPVPKYPNLRPWKPGESGNPGGRPAGYVTFADAYRYVSTISREDAQILVSGAYPEKWIKGHSLQYMVAARVYLETLDKAPAGLLTELADRSDGKVPQTVKQSIEVQGLIALPAPSVGATWAQVIDAHLALPALKSGGD